MCVCSEYHPIKLVCLIQIKTHSLSHTHTGRYVSVLLRTLKGTVQHVTDSDGGCSHSTGHMTIVGGDKTSRIRQLDHSEVAFFQEGAQETFLLK